MEDTEALVCQDIQQRQHLGIQKYNTTVANNHLSLKQWLQHAYEECLDQAVYLKRAMQELESHSEDLEVKDEYKGMIRE